MNQTVLSTFGLTKLYKPAVDHISMNIQQGDIYGLIGKNGAGKTTLIRMIASLILPSSGELSLFGEHTTSGLNKARERMGSVVETPALYPNLTAHQNLEFYRIQRGIPSKNIINETLKMVGLTDTDKKKFKNFSLGMKQRLGLALAILNHPDFIILDEPVNGLDPIGIVEMRETLKKLNVEYGITILISSHILTELSMIATRYGIIDNGKMIEELTAEELKIACQRSLSIKTNDTARAVTILETVLGTTKYKVINDEEIRLYDFLNNSSEVLFQLHSAGIRVNSIAEVGDSLEDYFTKVIAEESRHA